MSENDVRRPTAFDLAVRAIEAAEARARDLSLVPSRRATHDDDTDDIAELQAAKTRHLDELVPAVVEAVRANLGVSGYGLAKTLRENGVPVQKKGDESKAAMLAVERGWLRFEHGPRNAKLYFLASPPDDLPHGMSSHLPHLPYRGGGDVEVGQNTSPPATLNLSHLPGRCVECSFHVETQGHRPTCTTRHERTTV